VRFEQGIHAGLEAAGCHPVSIQLFGNKPAHRQTDEPQRSSVLSSTQWGH
jgi:hypothetical protein